MKMHGTENLKFGIQMFLPVVRVVEDDKFLGPFGHCDRLCPSKLCEKFDIYCEYSLFTCKERRIHLLQSWVITVTSYIPLQSV
jgi:hypothetical protein